MVAIPRYVVDFEPPSSVKAIADCGGRGRVSVPGQVTMTFGSVTRVTTTLVTVIQYHSPHSRESELIEKVYPIKTEL